MWITHNRVVHIAFMGPDRIWPNENDNSNEVVRSAQKWSFPSLNGHINHTHTHANIERYSEETKRGHMLFSLKRGKKLKFFWDIALAAVSHTNRIACHLIEWQCHCVGYAYTYGPMRSRKPIKTRQENMSNRYVIKKSDKKINKIIKYFVKTFRIKPTRQARCFAAPCKNLRLFSAAAFSPALVGEASTLHLAHNKHLNF